MIGLYPSIPHQAGLEALREALNKRKTHKVPTGKLVKMAEFVLKNNYFQVESKFLQTQVSTSSFNLLCGLGTLTIFSSSGLMVKTVPKIL